MSLPFSYLDTDPVLIPSYDAVKYTSTPKQWTDKPHIKPEATLYAQEMYAKNHVPGYTRLVNNTTNLNYTSTC